jgi:hypothetical protein
MVLRFDVADSLANLLQPLKLIELIQHIQPVQKKLIFDAFVGVRTNKETTSSSAKNINFIP